MENIRWMMSVVFVLQMLGVYAGPVRTYNGPHYYGRDGGGHSETLRFDNGDSVLLRYRNGVIYSERWYDANGKYQSNPLWVKSAQERHRGYRNHVPDEGGSYGYASSPVVNNNSAVANASVIVQTQPKSPEQVLAEERERLRREAEERNRPSEISITSIGVLPDEAAPKPASRAWHDQKGGVINARWDGVLGGGDRIVLVADRDERSIKASVQKFSEEDQKYIANEFKRLRGEGYEIYNGWWYRVTRKNAREVKNGGFDRN